MAHHGSITIDVKADTTKALESLRELAEAFNQRWQSPREIRAVRVIRAERRRQEILKAQGRFAYTLADDGLTEAEKLAAITEEVGEVAREVLSRAGKVTDGEGTDDALRKELTQIAALALAWLEGLG